MLNQYGAHNSEHDAIQKLLSIEQKSNESVHDYALRFRGYMNEREGAPWPEDMLTIIFWNGLKDYLKNATAVEPKSNKAYTTLQPLIDAANGHESSPKNRGKATTEPDKSGKRTNSHNGGADITGQKKHKKAKQNDKSSAASNANFDITKVSDPVKQYCIANNVCMRCGGAGSAAHTPDKCDRPFHKWRLDKRVNSGKYVPPHMHADEEEFDVFMHSNMDAKMFHAVRKQIGTNITCDVGCRDQHESLAFGKEYCTIADFPGMNTQENDVLWLHAQPSQLHSMLHTYLYKKATQPNLAAMVCVPAAHGPWRPLLHGFKLIKRYEAGTRLFRSSVGQNKFCQPPIEEPYEVWWDKSQNPATLPEPKHTLNAMSYGAERVSCSALVAGHKSSGILLDTGASTCFMSQHFANQLGLQPNTDDEEANELVQMPDGNTGKVIGSVQVKLKLGNLNEQCKCLVIQLLYYDVVLGQDWLKAHKAVIDVDANCCTLLNKHGAQVVVHDLWSKAHPEPGGNKLNVIRAKQARKAIRSGARAFMVIVQSATQHNAHRLHAMHSVTDAEQADDETIAGVLHGDKPINVKDQAVLHLLRKYQDVFPATLPDGLPPERSMFHTIPLEEGAKPPFRRAYRLSPAEMREVESTIKELLAKGYIEPSNSPYGAPVLFVHKKDGSLRMVIDYRSLNKLTVKNKYPLPRIDALLDQLQGAQYFSSLDLMSGYHQIKIKNDDVCKTAFNTPFGHYQWRVLSFGLTNAAATFQQEMNKIFGHLPFVVVYLDDILIFSKTKHEHMQHLETVFQILRNNKYYAKLSKCDFLRTMVPFLGHVVGKDGVQVDPAKTAAVEAWPRPQSIHDVRSFLGLANYFRKYVLGYSNLVAPLNALLKNDTTFQWSTECQQAFDGVKYALAHAPVLALPQEDKPYEMVCDASGFGIGAVLLQQGRPIAFESRSMSPAERNYGAGEQELLAVVHAMRTWRCYVEGAKCTLVTDHAPNTFLQSQPTLSRRQVRWSEFLDRFDYDWEYRPGRRNVADPLSRIPKSLMSLWLSQVSTRSSQKRGFVEGSAVGSVAKPDRATPGNSHQRSSTGMQTAADGALEHAHPDAPVNAGEPSSGMHEQSKLAADGMSHGSQEAGMLESCGLKQRITDAYARDPWFLNAEHTEGLVNVDGLWMSHTNQVMIPNDKSLRRELLTELHDSGYAGHFGIGKTYHSMRTLVSWDGMKNDVIQHVKTCHACQSNKGQSQRPAGKLQPLSIPNGKWQSVSMDFIMELPKTKSGQDAIWVCVDRLTKMVHIAATTTKVTAEGTAKLFRDNVWKHHGLPMDVVSDRDPRFTGNFSRELARLIGTTQSLSTAYHPESDGQTERVNRVLEDTLRHYVSSTHDDWDEYLSNAEYAINNAWHESIQTTPFMLNYGQHPRGPLALPQTSAVPKALIFTQDQQH